MYAFVTCVVTCFLTQEVQVQDKGVAEISKNVQLLEAKFKE